MVCICNCWSSNSRVLTVFRMESDKCMANTYGSQKTSIEIHNEDGNGAGATVSSKYFEFA